MKKRQLALGALTIALCLGTVPASAAPSIDNLHTDAPQTATVREDSQSPAARALTGTEVYCSQALPEQYQKESASADAGETKVFQLITASQSVLEETGRNGQAILDEIPTVRQLVALLDKPEASGGYDLDKLEQLTFMMDLKYAMTGYRVTVGSRVPDGTAQMRDGSFTVTLDGGEVLRAGDIDDFLILLVKPDGTDYTFLKMKEYDSETGVYTVEFPYIGSFMVMQVMDR